MHMKGNILHTWLEIDGVSKRDVAAAKMCQLHIEGGVYGHELADAGPKNNVKHLPCGRNGS